MRLELNAGGLVGISVSSYQKNLKHFSSAAQSVHDDFNTVQKALNNVTGGMNSTLQTVSGYIGERIKKETKKIENVAETTKETISFLNNAVATDKKVAKIVNKNNSNFYKVNPHLKPSSSSFLDNLFHNVCNLLEKGRKVFDFVKALPQKIAEFGVKCLKCAAAILKENIHNLLEFGKLAMDYMLDTLQKVWTSIWNFVTSEGISDIISGIFSVVGGIVSIVSAVVEAVGSVGTLTPVAIIQIIAGAMSLDSGANSIMEGIEKLVRKDNSDFKIPSWLRASVSPISYGLAQTINKVTNSDWGDKSVKLLNTVVQLVTWFNPENLKNLTEIPKIINLFVDLGSWALEVANDYLPMLDTDNIPDEGDGRIFIRNIINSITYTLGIV